jgi:WD40 repeat protein
LSGQVITALNANSAQAAEILLSEYPMGIYWPGNDVLSVYLNSLFLDISLDPLVSTITTEVQAPGRILGVSPDGRQVIYQGGDGETMMWERSTLESRVIPLGGAAYFANFSPDGRTIAVGSPDIWKVTLVDTTNMTGIKDFGGFKTAAPVYTAIPGPNRGVLAWYARGTLQFQDIDSGALGGELGYQDFIQGFSFSPDGSKALVAAGGLLQIVTTTVTGAAATQDLLVVLPDTPVSSPVFSPDGSLAAAGVGGKLVIWEAASGTQVAEFVHSSLSVRLVSFSPDGRALISVDEQNLLKCWRVP